MAHRLYRSALYVPASRARALDKARGLPCDAVLFDLEDAVAPDEKDVARRTLREALEAGGYGGRARIVRINALETTWGRADLEAVRGMECDGVLIPKVGGGADLDAVAEALPGRPLWAMMESPAAILNADGIAGHDALAGMVVGTNDLATALRARDGTRREPLLHALGACVMAARAHGRVVIDGVFNAFRDADGLAAECAQGRDMGFDGKSLIHPGQIAAANAAFGPSEAEVSLAERQIAAHAEAGAAGQGVGVLDGRIVEGLHVAAARWTLALRDAIAAAEDGA